MDRLLRGVLPQRDDLCCGHRTTRVTVPASPSTMTCWPLRSRSVAAPVPSTAGMPYSRATIELWLSGPPTSVTMPDASAKRDVQAGVVISRDQDVAVAHLTEVVGAVENARKGS